MRHPWAVLAAVAVVVLALALPGTSHEASASDWCSGGVCQEWVARYNGPASSYDAGYALAVDGSGNVYVTGESPGVTNYDYATVKYNAAGVQQWASRYDGPVSGDDEASALAVDGSGNVYVTGTSYGSGTGYDYATVKYNAAGVQQWAARYDGPTGWYDRATALAVDGSGNVYVTGYSAFESGGGVNYETVKYSAAGVQQWASLYGGPASGPTAATALAVDGSGNVYVTGHSVGFGTAEDYATVKYNAAGVQQWVARYDGPTSSYDQATALAVDGSGNVYVTGYSTGSGTGPDYATVMYDAAGVQQWVARYDGPGSGDDHANALAVDGSGNVYVTGYSPASGTGNDYATVKYDAGGGQQWVARYDGPASGDDKASALAVDGSGNVYVTGASSGSGTNWYDYATVMYDAGGVQQWVARYDGPASGYDWASALAVDGSGNVYVTGYSPSSGTGFDYATVKYHTPVFNRLGGQYNSAGFSGDNGPAQNAQLDGPPNGPGPHGLYETGTGSNLYLADTGNNRIRKVDTGDTITTVAGGGAGCAEPCSATDQSLNGPRDVFVDKAGNIFIADTGNNRIRKVDASSGDITTIAGDGTLGYSGDGGPATSAQLNRPHDVYPYGPMYAGTTDLLIADTDNDVIRWLYGPSGIINTLAGGGGGCAANDEPPYDGCPAIQAQFNAPEAVAADASLAVFVADTQNDLIRRFAPGDTIISTLAGGGNGCAANGTEPYYGCPATDAKLNDPAGVAAGSLIIADSGSATLSDLDLPSSEPGGSFGNASSCGGGVATVDWVFVVFALGLILARSRVGGLLMRIRGVAGLSRRPGTAR
jgi:hypothetical protein